MNVGFYGFGKMAQALVPGFKEMAILRMTDPSHAAKEAAMALGVDALSSDTLLKKSDMVIIAVKPQQLPEILPFLSSYSGILISLLAGIKIEKISKTHKVARVMPNLPAKLKEGMTALCFSKNIKPEEKKKITLLFQTTGQVCVVKESALNGVTAISGSGPAFLYGLTEGLMSHAAQFSLSPEQMRLLFAQTLVGAGKMMLENSDPVEALAKAVMSAKGTTEEGFKVLKKGHLLQAYLEIVNATFLKAKELNR